MAKRVQFRRGTTAQHASFVGAPGEITVDTSKNVVVVHDGATPGGWPANRLDSIDGSTTFSGQLLATAGIASNSTTTGSLVVTGGVGVSARVTAGQFVETSSLAFKENIRPISDALDIIKQLTGVTYDRTDSLGSESGLIAEDVADILPNMVAKDDDGNPYGIKYTKLIAYLIEAIKEQQSQIDELKNGK